MLLVHGLTGSSSRPEFGMYVQFTYRYVDTKHEYSRSSSYSTLKIFLSPYWWPYWKCEGWNSVCKVQECGLIESSFLLQLTYHRSSMWVALVQHLSTGQINKMKAALVSLQSFIC
jgi:hypothetical protein